MASAFQRKSWSLSGQGACWRSSLGQPVHRGEVSVIPCAEPGEVSACGQQGWILAWLRQHGPLRCPGWAAAHWRVEAAPQLLLEPPRKMHDRGVTSLRTFPPGARCEGAPALLDHMQLTPTSPLGLSWSLLHPPSPREALPLPQRGARDPSGAGEPPPGETRGGALRVGIHHTFISEYPSQNQPQH